MKKQLLAAWVMLFLVGTVGRAEATSSGRYLYDLSPYDVDPKSWAIWRKSVSTSEWQEWCHDLNSQRWNWWRQSMSPKNWRLWKETMGPADKALWNQSSKMLPDILAREEQEEPAVRFKSKVLKLKVHGTVMPTQQPSKAQPTQAVKGSPANHPANGPVQVSK